MMAVFRCGSAGFPRETWSSLTGLNECVAGKIFGKTALGGVFDKACHAFGQIKRESGLVRRAQKVR